MFGDRGEWQITYPDGRVYEGEVKSYLNNKTLRYEKAPHGRGTMNYVSGAKHVGYFSEGQRVSGKLYYKDGSVLEVNYVDDLPKGKATFIDSEGNVCTMVMNGWKAVGDVTYKMVDGSIYKGSIDNSFLMSGKGKMKMADGSKYVGMFKNHKFDGLGTMKYRIGTKYVGQWKDGKKHGQGTMKYLDKSVYTGSFANDVREGNGIIKYRDKSTYNGDWKNDKKHGRGMETDAKGAVRAVKYDNGTPVL